MGSAGWILLLLLGLLAYLLITGKFAAVVKAVKGG